MQAASSSGDYDAPEEGGVMDLDALASLPPLDEALIPEAMGILGFDMADLPGGAEEMPEDVFDDAQGAKKPKVSGGNQREVQKRYRERKKNYTKDLEKKVEFLETQLKEMRGAQEQAKEDEILTHIAMGRIVPGGGKGQHRVCGAGAMDDELSAHSAVEFDAEPGAGAEVGDCPLEHKRVAEAFHAKIADMRALLDAGASDAELSGALRETLNFCAPKRAMGLGAGPCNLSYQMILNKHAAALNAERDGAGPKRLVSSRAARPRGDRRDDGAVIGDHAREENTHSAGSACVGSVCGGPLRTVALDGTVMSEDDVAASVSAACDAFLMQTPPIEVARLIDWRDDYMEDLRRVYFERQKLGLQLAAAGGAIVSEQKPEKPRVLAANASREKSASGSDDSHDTGVGAGAGDVAVATVTLAVGGAPGASLVPQMVAHARDVETHASPTSVTEKSGRASNAGAGGEHAGAKMLNALAVVELLKQSVRREMRMKFEKTTELVTSTLSPRTAAHLASAMLPAMPDPLAIATEAKARGFTGKKNRREVEA